MKSNIYDTIIIGAGPAALSATLYASRYFLSHITIGKSVGGTMAKAHKIENYPGIESISGQELTQKIVKQLENFQTTLKAEEVKRVIKNDRDIFEITTDTSQQSYQAYSIILALGTHRRQLDIPGEKEFLGKGVSYCATCDAAFFRDKTAVVVGGANAATMAAMQLSQYANKVYLIYRGPALKGEPAWNQKVIDDPKIEVILNTNLTEISGGSLVEKVTLDKPHNNKKELTVQGVFIEIGSVPAASLAQRLKVELTPDGYIKVDDSARTNVPGVLAAGDITNGSGGFRQIVTAISEGAIAAKTAFDLKAERKQVGKKDQKSAKIKNKTSIDYA